MEKAPPPDRLSQMTAILAALDILKSRRANAMRKLKNVSDSKDFNEYLRQANAIIDEIEHLRNQLLSLTDEVQ